MRLHTVAVSLVLIAGIWLSSGTLAPYASTVANPPLIEPCHYPVNVDHLHHLAPFFLLAGAPPQYWAPSVVLRRILYPIVAYPFVRAAGFLAGGLFANMLITVVAVLLFGRFIRARFGTRAGIAVLWLLASYPGITYWAGLPYGYAAIVPASLWCMALLYRFHEAKQTREILAAATMLGIAFIAYDLLPFFLPAAVLTLAARSRLRWAAATAFLAVIPSAAVLGTLNLLGVPLANSNTSMYGTIIGAYRHASFDAEWLALLLRVPVLLLHNYLFSNFIFLPLLFLMAAILAARARLRFLSPPEATLLVISLAVFLFNNAAPPYYGWQLRGEWMARLYQPVFAAMLIAIGRLVAALPDSRALHAAIGAVVLANAAIVLGPVTLTPLGQYAYHEFYAHSPNGIFNENLRKLGRRPLGFCDPSHANDSRTPAAAPGRPAAQRPPFQYRYPPESR